MIIFANLAYLFLLLLLIPVITWYIWKQRKSDAGIQISTTRAFAKTPKTYKYYLKHIPFVLRLGALTALIVVLARPQKTDVLSNESIEGIDIMIVLDVSTSMLAEDLQPNRLEASKSVAAEFIMSRPNDNIGLVIFAGESFTQSPLTTDHVALVNLLNAVECGMIEDGTAIGNGLATAVNRIKDSQAISRVIILLTDGENNRGEITPLNAAEIARAFGIRVYTIGVSSAAATAPYKVKTNFGVHYQNIPVDIDEPTLQKIAAMTGGLYFRATDNKKLQAIYKEIDQLERTKINVESYKKKNEEYLLYALLFFAFLIAEILLRNTILRRIP